ncbi:MAG: hypothetical protein P8R37_12430 [Opitutae bacterium]|nr:hypothetical protein [Opitutae bacterium]
MSDLKSNNKDRINFEIPGAMKAELSDFAKQQGETVSTVIRYALRDKLNKNLIINDMEGGKK